MFELSINNKEVENFTNKLREMHRSNLPIVVRQTLNDMAFDVKNNTLMKNADKQFIIRNPGFFKKHSGVKKADGWDINKMQSEVGIIAGSNIAAQQLTRQEFGGTIGKRSFIYMNAARVSGVKNKMVRRQNYLKSREFIKGEPSRSRSDKSQFVARAIVAKRTKKLMLEDSKSGQTLFDVKDVKFSGKGGRNRKVFVRLIPLADYEQNRSVHLKARPFLGPASMQSFAKCTQYYITNAKKRFEKALK
ncbi:MAG: hypothetical protein PHW73_01025 [Atribacterota bacterium]|nr:hypothetical protein [Atribacterota bacterium]